MRLESSEGRGSTFAFTACLRRVAPSAPQAVATEGLRDVPVLVVDDNATTRGILEQQLQSWSMRPACAPNAEQAIAALQAAAQQGTPYPLVLLDSDMPGQDGFTLAGRLREHASLCQHVIMMLHAGDELGSVARCESLGVAAYLHKPAKESELSEAVCLALGLTEASTDEAVAATKAPQRRLRILLAEDSLVNQKLAVGLLRRHGHSVDVANNGREALAALAKRRYDAVLMDIQMPEMDGLEATALIRARERKTGAHLPVIAMTARATRTDRDECLAVGMDDYLAKPIRASRLLETLERLVPATSEEPPAPEPVVAAVEHMDWARALEVVQGDRDLLKDIIQAFLDECPSMLKKMRGAIREGKPTHMQRAAHTLKGSMRYLGARGAYNLADELESQSRAGSLDDAEEKLSRLEQEIERLLPGLQDFVRSGKIPDPASHA
jgi:CheY-like chemotaxis protein/HPt (histidine-containing phosphotransfer) domain-containing protein